MDLRKIGAKGAAAAVDLARRAILETGGQVYAKQQVEAWLAGMVEARLRRHLEESVVIGAFAGDRLLGFATLRLGTAVLDLLYVDPRARRTGVGRALVAEVERIAGESGLVELRVDASRLARPMLEQAGYEVFADNAKTVGGVAFDNVWLRKRLDRESADGDPGSP